MQLLKKYWWFFLLLIVGGYLYAQIDKKETKKVEREKISLEAEQKLNRETMALIRKHDANYKWIVNFTKRDFTQKLMTKDLQVEWILNSPIFFYGNVTDISIEGGENYLVKIANKGYDFLLLNTSFELNITCEKSKVDALVASDKEVIKDFGLGNQVVVIAKVNSVSTRNIKERDSESEELKIGSGYCVDLLSTNTFMPNFSFLKN
jgi:hypothetical protein